MQAVTSWGRLSRELHQVVALRDRGPLPNGTSLPGSALAFGNGRSYGDACLNPGGRLWAMRGLDRFIAFDTATGVIECEAGVLLREIVAVALPCGWFLPVTPGTQFATLGGAIANDVHGKNHHRAGTLGGHVDSFWLARSDGSLQQCSRSANAALFEATIAGLGLTGVIVSARLQLRRVAGPWMAATTAPFDTLDDFFALSRQAERDAEYGVAWIDCLSGSAGRARGIFFSADHADGGAAADREPPRQRTRSVPVTPPWSLVNGVSLRLFNALYHRAHRQRAGRHVQHLEPFFYPLDKLLDWNRLYGPRGFYQYQCVVPRNGEAAAVAELLAAIKASGTGSFLAVLKTFGEHPGAGLLSFPLPGTTLALDFPNRGEATLRLFARLDAIVGAARGRLYPAKDACMSRALFEQGYPRLGEFLRFRDPGISSAMSRRLMGA